VAISVLAMLVILVAQIFSSGNSLISGSTKRLSADAEAREVFSRFDRDLAGMPRRRDLDALVSSTNNAIFFFSEAPGFHSTPSAAEHNTLSLVGYRVNDEAQLERLGKGLGWQDPAFLTYDADAVLIPQSRIEAAWGDVIGSSPTFNNGQDDAYHLLADSVFRIAFCFKLADGTYTLTLPATVRGARLQAATDIVMTLAVLDGYSRRLVKSPGRLADALPDPAQGDLNTGVLPVQLWQSAADDTAAFANAAGIAESAAARVRIYQRSFPLRTR
jgi:hypothetical protein